MKICSVCLQSDILCSGCSRKLDDGKITRTDIELSRAIHKISKEKKFDVDFIQSEEDSGKVFVVVESNHASRFIGPGGRNIKKLSQLLGKQVKLLEKAEGSEKHVIEKMIGAPILGVNKVYPQEIYSVRVEKRYARTVQPLADVISKILDRNVRFVFE